MLAARSSSRAGAYLSAWPCGGWCPPGGSGYGRAAGRGWAASYGPAASYGLDRVAVSARAAAQRNRAIGVSADSQGDLHQI